jgi:GTP cyclohydrolase I
MKIDPALETSQDSYGDEHFSASEETPLREDAFILSDEEKIERISQNVRDIMLTLGLDLDDDSLKGTPDRVAKMYVREIFGGLHPERKPKSSIFRNKYKYGEMLVEKNITVYSTCEHHLLPIVGRAHIGYISNGSVVGLSKMNRIVDYFAKRPQVQERMNIQIVRDRCQTPVCQLQGNPRCGQQYGDCRIRGSLQGRSRSKGVSRLHQPGNRILRKLAYGPL